MKINYSNVQYVIKKCVRSIQALVSSSKGLASIQPTQSNSPRRLTRHYAQMQNPYCTLLARALQGLNASLKGVACGVAIVIGIALSMPMAQAPAAQYVPIKSYAKAKTINGTQWSCLSKLWGKESAWNHLADNPHSTAFGIPQILGLTTTNPIKQIDLGFKYLQHRYSGDACKAWKHHKNKGWY